MASGLIEEWMTKFKNCLQDVSFVTNFLLVAVVLIMQKSVETDFSCPCHPDWNIIIVAPYFVVPALLAFILMCFTLDFQVCKTSDGNKCCSCGTFNINWVWNMFICSIPAIAWVTMLFFDGRYYACAATDWPGRYVPIEGNNHRKWCQSLNDTLTNDRLILTQWWFGFSQILGFCVIGGVILLTLVYKCYICCGKKDNTLQRRLQKIQEAAEKIEKEAESTRIAAEAVLNESVVKTADAVKKVAEKAAAAAAAAKDAVAAAKTAVAAADSRKEKGEGATTPQETPGPNESTKFLKKEFSIKVDIEMKPTATAAATPSGCGKPSGDPVGPQPSA